MLTASHQAVDVFESTNDIRDFVSFGDLDRVDVKSRMLSEPRVVQQYARSISPIHTR
jgi:hypothetical protein